MAELRNRKNECFRKKAVVFGFRTLIARNFLRNGDAAGSANIAGAGAPSLTRLRGPRQSVRRTDRLLHSAVDVGVTASECGFLFLLLRETATAVYIYPPLTKSEINVTVSRCGAA